LLRSVVPGLLIDGVRKRADASTRGRAGDPAALSAVPARRRVPVLALLSAPLPRHPGRVERAQPLAYLAAGLLMVRAPLSAYLA
jgi:hypothetical protein